MDAQEATLVNIVIVNVPEDSFAKLVRFYAKFHYCTAVEAYNKLNYIPNIFIDSILEVDAIKIMCALQDLGIEVKIE